MGNSSGTLPPPSGKEPVYVHEYDTAEQHKLDAFCRKLGKEPVYVHEYDAAEQHKWDEICKKLGKQKECQKFSS